MTDHHHDAVTVCGKAAEGLDLRDPEDRVVFRLRLAEATKITKVTAIQDWARALGESPRARTRDAAVRALARGWGG